MSHLGEKATMLVDGQLGVEAAERALMHIAGCAPCREAVEIERLTKRRLATLGAPCPDSDLVHRLMGLAGPSGPLPPRPGHVPGSPRPQLTTAAGGLGGSSSPGGTAVLDDVSRGLVAARPPGRRGSSRPPLARAAIARPTGLSRMVRVSRSSRNRMAAAMVGAACLVGAGVAGGIANSTAAGQQVIPPVDSFVLEHGATTSNLPFADQTVVWGTVGAGR
jgi:hypothetical protein